MEKKILILASNSFIAKNLKNFFYKKYNNVFYLSRKDIDFKNQELLETYISEIDPEIVINCCGLVGSSVKNIQISDFDVLNENIILNINILNSCKNKNIKKIILFSSYRLFGDNIHENYDEECIQNCNIEYNIGYLSSKKILDQQIKLFMKNYKINIVCLLLTNIFGYFDDFTINSRIVPSLMSKINKAKNENSDIIIPSNKNTLVNIVYADDISKIVEKCMLSENIVGNILVFNKNGIISLENLTDKISNLFNYKNKIIFNSNNDTNSVVQNNNIMKPNLDKLNSFFSDIVFTNIEKALELTYNHLTNNVNRNII